MNGVNELVSSQTVSVKETENKFETIALSIEKTKEVTNELNQISASMTQDREVLVGLMQNLSAIAEENAASTEEASSTIQQQTASMDEVANSSVKLAQIAEGLQAVISKFKL